MSCGVGDKETEEDTKLLIPKDIHIEQARNRAIHYVHD
jgi:hypothetical protein